MYIVSLDQQTQTDGLGKNRNVWLCDSLYFPEIKNDIKEVNVTSCLNLVEVEMVEVVAVEMVVEVVEVTGVVAMAVAVGVGVRAMVLYLTSMEHL